MGVLKQPQGFSLISTAGLEPAKLSQLILNQPCLPISPRRCYLSNEPLTSLKGFAFGTPPKGVLEQRSFLIKIPLRGIGGKAPNLNLNATR